MPSQYYAKAQYLINEEHILVNEHTGKFYDRKGREIELFPDKDGYLCVNYPGIYGMWASKVAAYAYYGEIALTKGVVISFRNYDRRDIRKCNLQPLTRRELQQKPKWYDGFNFIVRDEQNRENVAAFKEEKEAQEYAQYFGHSIVPIRWR